MNSWLDFEVTLVIKQIFVSSCVTLKFNWTGWALIILRLCWAEIYKPLCEDDVWIFGCLEMKISENQSQQNEACPGGAVKLHDDQHGSLFHHFQTLKTQWCLLWEGWAITASVCCCGVCVMWQQSVTSFNFWDEAPRLSSLTLSDTRGKECRSNFVLTQIGAG